MMWHRKSPRLSGYDYSQPVGWALPTVIRLIPNRDQTSGTGLWPVLAQAEAYGSQEKMQVLDKAMKHARRQLGDQGEDLAAAALKQQGYKILERNYVTPLGEIDLIAKQGKTVVVVEVKTRRGSSFGAPQEAVNSGKQNRLRRLADYYLKAKRLTGSPVRFDVVAVTMTENVPQVEIIQNAF